MLAKLSVDHVLTKARSDTKKDEISQAQKLYQAFLQTFPKNKRALQALAALNKLKQNNATQSPPQEAVDQLVKYYQEECYEDAKRLAQSITQQFPKYLLSWKILGAALQKSEKISEVLNVMQQSIALNSEDAEAHNNLRVIDQEICQFKKAEEIYRQAISFK